MTVAMSLPPALFDIPAMLCTNKKHMLNFYIQLRYETFGGRSSVTSPYSYLFNGVDDGFCDKTNSDYVSRRAFYHGGNIIGYIDNKQSSAEKGTFSRYFSPKTELLLTRLPSVWYHDIWENQ